MKSICIAVALVAASVGASAQNVGISASVNQPGLYGRIDIGNVPQPPVLVYPQPMVITQSPVATHQRPIYLRVPPGHERQWAKHCGQYNACGQPVYFVREDWYQQNYRPREGRSHDGDRDRDGDRGDKHGKNKDKGQGKGHGKHGD